MKKSLLAFSTLIILSILFYPQAEVISMSTGSPGGMSGAPGDNSCVQCHNSFGLNTGSAIVNITSNIPITGYVPGNTYTITASAAQTGISKYGFEVHEALGSILVTNSTTTKHVGVGSNRITHEAAGTTVLVNSISWSFDWVAPPVGSGNATFYGAFVAADYPSGNSNDNVYTTNLIVSEFTSVLGCTDTLACNYNTLATVDDSSCVYEAISTVITEICLGDSVLVGSSVYTVAGTYTDVLTAANTCDSIITTTVTIGLSGCTDSLAINYNVSATCDDGNCNYSLVYENLFFSEWSEGSFNNKYFEIFNPTNDTISLVNYAFARVSNSPTIIGVYEYWNNFDSGSVILPMDVFIVAHPSADSLILAQANMTFGSLSNGDDGIALVYGNEPVSPMAPDGVTYEIVDWLGDWNGDPGQGWTIGGTFAGTRNHTIIRKCNIANGDTSWTNSAANQWMVLPNDYWNNIGYHTFNTSVYDSLSFTICNGLSIAVGSNIYDSTGVYTDVLVAANGCDSVVITDLTVLTSAASVIVNDITICNGDSILVDSNYYYISGTYIDTLQNTVGCDSIITTNLTVQTPTYQDITICDGDSIVVGNSVYNSTGSYADTITSSIGCDSIVHINLTIYSQFNSIYGGILNNSIGGGGFYSGSQHLEMSCYIASELVSAVVYAQDTVVETFQIRDNNGNILSDTMVTVIPGGQRIYFNYTMSGGSDYELGVSGNSNDLFRSNAGVSYPYNFGSLVSLNSSSAGGQYYYFFYDIEVKQSSQPTNYSICDGESITVAGNVYNATGLYIDSLFSNLGCDSIVLTNLIVNSNITFTNNQTICIGETYTINGNIYDTTGTYVDSLQTIAGCDSIITTNLTILSISPGSSINNQTICMGDYIMVGTHTYFAAGTYFDTLTSDNGCDSIVTTNLTVQTANYASVNGGILDTVNGPGAFSNYNGHLLLDASVVTIIKSANVYALDTNIITFELRDSSGLVLESVTHTVYPGIQNLNFNFTLPIGTDYQLGINGGNPGLYRGNADTTTFAYPFISGPVSITSSVAGDQYYYFYYDIEFMPFSTYNEVSICDGDSLIVGSHIYDTPGQYVDTFVANNSCDSVVFTILDFHQSLSLQIGSAPSPAEICLGDTILLEASPGFVSYAWTNGMTGQIIYDTPTTDTWYMVEAVDTNGCVVKEDINVYVDTCITGVNEISITNELKVYPNPASDRVIIEITLVGRQEIVQLQVINNLGQIIETHQATSRQELSIDISHLPSGTYLLNLAEINGNTIATQKLTKE
ncbi:MAG: T9SS type A sorting domain-containing protein [Flavobacteriales bacterium]|nr:T9SS type A sorting domain-containing protein [Flavobacteriales bacterium]